MPALVRAQEKFGGDDFTVVAVNAWNEPADQVASYAKTQGIKYPVLLQGAAIAEKYALQGVPTSFSIDPRGMIADSELGFEGPAALEARVRTLVEEAKKEKG